MQAEREQLASLVQKGIWSGAERTFADMVELEADGPGTLAAADWRLGARIARTRGDMDAVRERLTRAFEIEPDDEMRAEIQQIAKDYGPIVIDVTGGGQAELLAPVQAPFAPDAQAAIGFTQARLTEEGRFDGLLPVGAYTISGTRVEVAPGAVDPLFVEIARDGTVTAERRRGTTGGSEAPALELHVEVGPAITVFSGAAEGIHPAPFTGPGVRLGAGTDVWPGSGDLGFRAQVGYHNLLGGNGDTGGPRDQLHLGYGWLAGTVRLGPLTLAAGPQFAIGQASATGLDVQAWQARCDNTPSASGCPTPEAELATQSISSTVLATGGTLGATWALSEGTLRPAVGLNTGALYDGSRLLPWAQLVLAIRL